MSDGGAQVIVQTVSLLARFRLGRIILLAVVVLLIFRGLASSIGISPWILLGVIGAGWAAFAGVVAIRRRRRELRTALDERLRIAEASDPDRPRTLGERVERSLALRSERMLCLTALRVALTARNRDEAVQRVEALGIERLESLLVDTLEDLFLLQVVLAHAAALLVAAAPHLIFLLLRE